MSTDVAPTNIGYVYAIESAAFPGFIKIGRTNNVKRRIEAINFSLPINQYELVASFSTHNSVLDEKLTHDHFKNFRFEREYFKLSGDDKQELINYFMKAQNVFVLSDEMTISQYASANKKKRLAENGFTTVGEVFKNYFTHTEWDPALNVGKVLSRAGKILQEEGVQPVKKSEHSNVYLESQRTVIVQAIIDAYVQALAAYDDYT